MWDMETGDRKFTLWASSAPPLSEMQVREGISHRSQRQRTHHDSFMIYFMNQMITLPV